MKIDKRINEIKFLKNIINNFEESKKKYKKKFIKNFLIFFFTFSLSIFIFNSFTMTSLLQFFTIIIPASLTMIVSLKYGLDAIDNLFIICDTNAQIKSMKNSLINLQKQPVIIEFPKNKTAQNHSKESLIKLKQELKNSNIKANIINFPQNNLKENINNETDVYKKPYIKRR